MEILYQKINKGKRFAGYASVFNVTDKCNDRILPGAFSKSILLNNNLKLLWEHNPLHIIGEVKVKEDKRGLYVNGTIDMDFVYAFNAYNAIKNMDINHMSIGYKTLDCYKRGRIRYIKKVELCEISLVSRPANVSAKIYRLEH